MTKCYVKKCDREATLGFTSCEQCRIYYRERNKKRTKEPGRCSRCGVITEKASQCQKCASRTRQRLLSYKVRVIEGYGGKCVCCGESEPLFLQLDHVNNDGAIERKKYPKSTQLYLKVIREGFPSDYQLLCANCNFGRSLNGGVCPHQVSNVEILLKPF